MIDGKQVAGSGSYNTDPITIVIVIRDVCRTSKLLSADSGQSVDVAFADYCTVNWQLVL